MTHPTNPNAQNVATIEDEFDLSATDIKTHYEVTVWHISEEHYDFVLDIESVSFSETEGNCGALSGAPLTQIVQEIADHVIAKGAELGYPECASEEFKSTLRVYSQECGDRSGSGCATTFEVIGTNWVYRPYEVECPGDGNEPTVTEWPGSYSNCTTGEGTNIEP